MQLEKNPVSRRLLKRLLALGDKVNGKSFPGMVRTRQISVYACGPATLEMLFSFVGQKVTQTGLIRSIRAANKIKLYGIDVHDMGKAARIAAKGKFVFWKKQMAKISDLDLAINKYKYPVGVEWQGVFYESADEDDGHYGVVTAVNKKKGFLRIADPYFNGYFKFNGVDRRFSIREFYQKWWDTNEISITGTTRKRTVTDTRVMFVITPKGETWPKKLGMKKI